MNLFYSEHFKKRLKKHFSKNPQLRFKVAKQLHFLEEDIEHPSLKAHKLKGKRNSEYAIWIEGDLRILFIIVDDGLLLTDVVKHDEY